MNGILGTSVWHVAGYASSRPDEPQPPTAVCGRHGSDFDIVLSVDEIIVHSLLPLCKRCRRVVAFTDEELTAIDAGHAAVVAAVDEQIAALS